MSDNDRAEFEVSYQPNAEANPSTADRFDVMWSTKLVHHFITNDHERGCLRRNRKSDFETNLSNGMHYHVTEHRLPLELTIQSFSVGLHILSTKWNNGFT